MFPRLAKGVNLTNMSHLMSVTIWPGAGLFIVVFPVPPVNTGELLALRGAIDFVYGPHIKIQCVKAAPLVDTYRGQR